MVLSKKERGFAVRNDEADEDYAGEAVTSHQLLFIHQNTAEKKLLAMCGDIALLDATYKTTNKHFLLVGHTDVGDRTAAEFICEVETTDAVSEALQTISGWNPLWTPS